MVLISVIIPTYNRAKMLPRAIESVIKQTSKEWELIIVDDGSSDDTKEVVGKYLSDGRIKYIYQENKGVSAARNHGAKHASGEYLCFLDSDDYVEAGWLRSFLDRIGKSNCNVCFCGVLVKSKSKEKIELPSKRLERKGMGWGLPLSGSYLIKTIFFKEVGQFDERVSFSENTELMIRIQMNQPDVCFIDTVNLIYLQSFDGGNINFKNKVKSLEYVLKKHTIFFKKNVDDLNSLNSVLSVTQLKLKNFSSSRKYIVKCISVQPFTWKHYVRYLISFSPYFANLIYGK